MCNMINVKGTWKRRRKRKVGRRRKRQGERRRGVEVREEKGIHEERGKVTKWTTGEGKADGKRR